MNLPNTVALAGALLMGFSALPVAHAADDTRIVNEGRIGDQWMLADGVKLAAPGYPAAFADKGDNVCIAMGYLIKPDGSTGDFALLRAWTSSNADKDADKEPVAGFWEAFSQAGVGALSQWRFKPRPEVSAVRPTYTVATLHFMGKQAADVGELRDHCKISDLPTFVQREKSDKYQRGSLEKLELERYRRWQDDRHTMVENPGREPPKQPSR